MINLYIMRHGDAQAYARSDAERELTPYGQQQVRHNSAWLKQQVEHFDMVLVSPYIRAQQTQQIVCSGFEPIEKIETLADLVPEGDPSVVHDYVDTLIGISQPQSILLVSHMPLVSYLVESFTATRQAPIFPTAGIAHISYDPQIMKGEFKLLKAPS